MKYHDAVALSMTAPDLEIPKLGDLVPCHQTSFDVCANGEGAVVTQLVVNNGEA